MHISENLFIAKYLLNPIKDDSINGVAASEGKTRQALSAKRYPDGNARPPKRKF